MIRARQLVTFFLLVPLAAAQERPAVPAEVTSVTVSTQEGKEIRIELGLNAEGTDARVTATYSDSLILDVEGAVYRGLPRRIPVNAAGIRAVRVWMQSEVPPLTRVVVEIDRTEQYLVSSDRKGIELRVGPSLGGNAPVTSNPEPDGGMTPSPAARGAASTSAIRAFAGIFRHRAGKHPTYSSSKMGNGQPAPIGVSQSQTAQSQTTADNATSQNTSPPAQSTPDAASSVKQISRTAETASQDKAAGTRTTPETSESSTEARAGAVVPSPVGEPAARQGSADPGELPLSTGIPLDLSVSSPVVSESASNSPAREAQSIHESAASASATASATDGSKPQEVNSGVGRVHIVPTANPGMRTEFKVKFVEEGSAYLDGGRSSGLAEGMKLVIWDRKPLAGADKTAEEQDAVAELVVVGIAETSAVTEIHTPKRDVVPGDLAYLSSGDVQAIVQEQALGVTRKYPVVVTFSEEGDALDEEARANVPRPPMPSVNRASGRFGFDYTSTQSNDASQLSSASLGALVQADFTRIGGSYWNLRGYWRGRLVSNTVASQQTLQDLINRTYHLSLTYENPNAPWVAGVGRLFLPWATSLETLDGGYFGARVGHGVTAGLFGGSTPDPTSWSYSPNRHIGGAFLNEEGGSFDAFHFSSTAGIGKSFQTATYTTTTSSGTTQTSYEDNRPFAFFENSLSYKRTFSLFSALQADKPSANPAVASPGAGVSRSFLTVRFQPFSRIELSANHTYFRDVPTFDPQLVGTGLLDKYLFQGFSGGVRIEVLKNVAVYTDLGRSSRSGDAKTSLNQMYGITFLKIPKFNLRADAHFSRFASSFGSGTYRAFSLSRNLGEEFHVEILGGDQVFTSSLAGNQSARFLTTNMDTSLGAMFFLQGGFTLYRGQLQNYNQWNAIIGYRFDNKWKHK